MKKILFICIGNSNIIGDSLGPLIGSFLQEYANTILKNTKIEVQGTIENPIGYNRINKLEYNNNKYTNVIIIDSALGNEKNIGKVLIDTSYLYAGNGTNDGKRLEGDIIIRGIVGKNHHNTKRNISELLQVNTHIIEQTATKIITTIISWLVVENKYKNNINGNTSYIR